MAVTLLGDGGWSTSTLGCPLFATVLSSLRWPSRKPRFVVLNDAPLIPWRTTNRKGPTSVGPKTAVAKRPRSALSIVEGPERRRSRSDRSIANSVANHEPEGPDFSRAKNSRHEAPRSALSIVEGPERRRSRSDRSIALLLWLLVFHLRLIERNQTLASTHPQNTSKLTCQGPQFTSKTSNQHKMNHLIKKINPPKLAF